MATWVLCGPGVQVQLGGEGKQWLPSWATSLLPQTYLQELPQQGLRHLYGIGLPTKVLEAAEWLHLVLGVLTLGWTWMVTSWEILTPAVWTQPPRKYFPRYPLRSILSFPFSCTPIVASMMSKLAGVY